MSRSKSRFSTCPWLRALVAGVVVGSFAFQAHAGALEVGKRVPLLMRVLAYDRQLTARQEKGVVLIGVAFAPDDAGSVKEKDAVLTALSASNLKQIKDFTLSVVAVPYTGPLSLKSALGDRRAAVLYVCEGLESSLREIMETATRTKMATMSGSESLTRQGLAFAAFDDGGKGRVIVNLKSAKAQGLDLDATMLNLAIVLRGSSTEPAPLPQKTNNVAPAPPPSSSPPAPVFQPVATALKRRVSGRAPAYPQRARIQGWEATLLANIYISAAGTVERIEFIETDEHFEDTVKEAVKAWKFKPYLVGGKPVSTYTKMTFAFKLQ